MPAYGASGRPNPYLWNGDAEEEKAPEGVFLGEPELKLLGLPQGPKPARPRRDAAEEASPAARTFLAELAAELAEAAARGPSGRRFPLAGLAGADRAAVLDLLGDGEVSGIVALAHLHQVSETIFPGLWRVTPDEGEGWLEVGDAPALVRDAAAAVARASLPLEHIVPPDGAMNVMGVLAEVRAAAKAWRPGQPNLVMNFTLLPMTEADADFLAAVLDRGPVQLSSGGYGSARVLATGLKQVWAVQFLNSMGVVILDTLEIGDLPEAARAQPQDLEDSAARLLDLLKGGFA